METSRTANKRLGIVAALFVVVALCRYASHIYQEHQSYKTGVYIGKAAFTAADLQNRHCLSSFQRGCEAHDLNKDSVMENALASASIIPSLSDVTAIYTGFRDGWREARTAAFTIE